MEFAVHLNTKPKDTKTQEVTLSDVLKHAEHGSVEEFVNALKLARLDLESAIREGLLYDMEAGSQYLRVLVLHQRRDIFEWLLDNNEIVYSFVNTILSEVCKQPSLSFFLWLQRKLLERFHELASFHPEGQFVTSMNHGTVDIASYLFKTVIERTGECPYGLRSSHPNVEEFWRNEYLPFQLSTKKDMSSICDLIGADNVSHALYALKHWSLTYAVEYSTKLASWPHPWADCMNRSLEHGHWSIAKFIIEATREGSPIHLPKHELKYFRVRYPERLSKEDMSEMIAWSMSCLRELLLTPDEESKEGVNCRRDTSTWSGSRERHCVIAAAFVAACDYALVDARKALLEDEALKHVIETQLKMYTRPEKGEFYRPQEMIFWRKLLRSSTIDMLVEHGMSPSHLRDFVNIIHMYGRDPDWLEWAITVNIRCLKCESTGDANKDVVLAFVDEVDCPFSNDPFVFLPEQEQVDVLKWVGKNLDWTTDAKRLHRHYIREVIHHKGLVTAKNLFDFIPSTKQEHLLIALRHFFGEYCLDELRASRSVAESQELIDALTERIPLAVNILPFNNAQPHLHKSFSTLDEAVRVLLVDRDVPYPTKERLFCVKAHVMRLEARLKALEDVDGDRDRGRIKSVNYTSLESKTQGTYDPRMPPGGNDADQQSAAGSPVEKAVMNVVKYSKLQLRRVIRHYRSLGFVLASDTKVLDFEMAQWFLNGLPSISDVSQKKEEEEQEGEEEGETEETQGKAPEGFSVTLPVFQTLVSMNYGSNTKLFHHWRTSLGVAQTPETYLNTIRDPLVLVGASNAKWYDQQERRCLRRLEKLSVKKIRMIAAAIKGLHCELGYDIGTTGAGEAVSEVVHLVHRYMCEYACQGRSADRFYFESGVKLDTLQVTAMETAVVIMLEALDAALNNAPTSITWTSGADVENSLFYL